MGRLTTFELYEGQGQMSINSQLPVAKLSSGKASELPAGSRKPQDNCQQAMDFSAGASLDYKVVDTKSRCSSVVLGREKAVASRPPRGDRVAASERPQRFADPR